MGLGIKGLELSPYIRRSEPFQGEIAPIGGPDTLLTHVMTDDPVSMGCVSLFFGTLGGDGLLFMRQGVHYRVSGRNLYWLGSAPFPLTSSSQLSVNYWTKGNAA